MPLMCALMSAAEVLREKLGGERALLRMRARGAKSAGAAAADKADD